MFLGYSINFQHIMGLSRPDLSTVSKGICEAALHHLSVVKLSVHIDLSLSDVTSQVRNRMSDI